MNDYNDNFSEQAIRTRQTIYKKYRTLFRETEALEKDAIRELGESHPIAEELSTLWIHMMNGEISIEKNLYSNIPGRVTWAPVKAPFSWPKSSLSNRFSGSEAQSTGTKGRLRRSLFL